MRKVAAVFLGIAAVLTILVGVSLAAEKFAYVDLIRIASEYNKAKDYNKSLEEKAKIYESEFDKKVNEFKSFQDKLNLSSDKEREAKRPEIEGKVKTLQDFKRDKETELRKKDFENSKEIADDIRAAIKQHAEKEGYTFVFDDRILIYQPKNLDITDKIIEILNKDYKK